MNSQEKMTYFLKLIKAERMKRNYSQEKAGDFIGCSQTNYSKKEKGLAPFTLLEFLTICEKLGLETDFCSCNPTLKIGLKKCSVHRLNNPILDQCG